jgi:hypothetical protein
MRLPKIDMDVLSLRVQCFNAANVRFGSKNVGTRIRDAYR